MLNNKVVHTLIWRGLLFLILRENNIEADYPE
jgi:hypothetical protein